MLDYETAQVIRIIVQMIFEVDIWYAQIIFFCKTVT